MELWRQHHFVTSKKLATQSVIYTECLILAARDFRRKPKSFIIIVVSLKRFDNCSLLFFFPSNSLISILCNYHMFSTELCQHLFFVQTFGKFVMKSYNRDCARRQSRSDFFVIQTGICEISSSIYICDVSRMLHLRHVQVPNNPHDCV